MASFCQLCGNSIHSTTHTGENLDLPGRGIFCQTCANSRATCDVCGARLDNKRRVLTDGRRICGQCHATAVYDIAKALPVYEQVKGIISQKLGLALNIPTALVLIGRDQLSEILQKANYPTDDATHLLGIYMRQGRKRAIYVQSGLPRLLLMQVIAHEWGHAWHMENAPLLQDIRVKEGFAEWVAYKTMEAIGASQALTCMVAREDLYGQGLRYVLDIEVERGKHGVLTWCRQTR